MKTEEIDRVDTDHGVAVKPRKAPRLDAPPQPSRTARTQPRATATVVALLLTTAIVAVVAWILIASGPVTESSPLYDQSITAREHAPGAPVSQSLLDRSISGREGAGAVSRADSATAQQDDSVLSQSAQAREHAALIEQRDSLLTRSVRARER